MKIIRSLWIAGLGLSACNGSGARSSVASADPALAGPGLEEPSDLSSIDLETLAVRAIVHAPEHDRLASLAGQYAVTGSFFERADGEPRRVSGAFVAEWRAESATLSGSFEGELWSRPFHFVSDLSFDSLLGCWVETWCARDGEVVRPLAHGYEEEPGLVVTTRYEDGLRVRDEISIAEDTIVRRMWQTDADGVDFLKMELVFQRSDGAD